MSNVFFASTASDYFSPGVETNPMLHTWTLAVEEQFYVVWPLLIVLGLQVFRSRRLLTGLLCSVIAASLAASIWFTARGGVLAFYGLPTRAWEFGVGGLAAIFPQGALKWFKGWTALGLEGIAAILWSVHSISDPTDFPGGLH